MSTRRKVLVFVSLAALIVIATAQIQNPASSSGATGAAGGDLTGTYPNPTIKASASLTTPVIGAATGTSLALTGALSTGANGGAAGLLNLLGSTSGTATITAPAVAGTSTNAFSLSNVLQGPNGAVGTPTYGFTNCTNCGWYTDGTIIRVAVGGIQAMAISPAAANAIQIGGTGYDGQITQINSAGNSKIQSHVSVGTILGNDLSFGWSSIATVNSIDTNLSRSAAAVVAVGNGTAGNTTGKLKASGYMSVGTKFTSNSGCTEGTTVGGATAGKFTVGQNTACTVIITMGDSATAPNGWACTAYDQTAVPAVAIRQTASSTTTASLLMTVGTNDVVVFNCIGY